MKLYLPVNEIDGSHSNFIKVDTYYTKGSYGSKRGYYLSVTPVKVENKDGYKIESTFLYSGFKKLLLEVGRKSNSAEQKAMVIAEDTYMELVNMVLDSCNLTLSDKK